jgi:hypothetical protein
MPAIDYAGVSIVALTARKSLMPVLHQSMRSSDYRV